MPRKRYDVFVPVLLNLVFLLGMGLFVGFYYELSDDWFIARNIANGQYNQVFCSYFIQHLTGFLQEWIYPVNAFLLLQIILAFVSLTTICCIYFDVFDFEAALLFSLLLECTFAVNFYSIITFTKTAGVLVAAGALTILWAHHEKKSIGYSIYGLLLALLGSFYRLKIFYAVGAIFLCCVVAILADQVFRLGWKSLSGLLKELLSVRNVCLVLVLLICVFGCDHLSAKLILESDEDIAYYEEYNHLRSTLVDYPLPKYEEAAAEFEKLGVSENDYTMLKNWYFDDQGFGDTETLQGIVDIQQSFEHSKHAVFKRIKNMVYSVLMQILELRSESILILTLLASAALMILLFRGKSWMYVLVLLMGVGVLYIYLMIGGRVKYRAVVPLWLSLMVCLCYISRFLHLRDWVLAYMQRFRRRIGVLTVVAAIVCCCVILYCTATTVPEENKIINQYNSDSLNSYIVSEEDKTFVLSHISYKRLRNRTVLQDPLYIGPDPVFDRCLYFGSPYYAHPSYNALLESYGVTNLYTALIDSEEFLFVDREKMDIRMMLNYLTEQYGNGKTFTCERVAVRNRHYIYRIYTAETSPHAN